MYHVFESLNCLCRVPHKNNLFPPDYSFPGLDSDCHRESKHCFVYVLSFCIPHYTMKREPSNRNSEWKSRKASAPKTQGIITDIYPAMQSCNHWRSRWKTASKGVKSSFAHS